MNTKRVRRWLQSKKGVLILTVMLVILCASQVFAADTEEVKELPALFASFWSLIPAIVAIALALITKEVYSSLFIGIVVGGLLYSNFSFTGTVSHVVKDGMISVLSDSYNVGIIIFLVVLGTVVALMNKAGGSRAFGEWAGKHIKSRVGAQIITMVLGALIFIDDYFNCLTVGSVMRPITDRHQVSRAKLAYLIDATAAPICIIAPISSWAAAVSGFVEGEDGLKVFIEAIPYNFYALLTIVMVIGIIVMKFDFGPMAKHEANAINGDLFSEPDGTSNKTDEEQVVSSKGKVIDLVLPIIVLIISCVIAMIYTGGFFEGTDFVTAFSECDASLGLAVGSIIGLIITVIIYLIRRVLSFKDCMDCIPDGFKQMVPAILILTFAWTLKAMTDSLGAKEFVAALMENSAQSLAFFLPAIIFVVACFLAFATGTSWGTFGILIPIVVSVFQASDHTLLIVAISACMAGAVCGDHCSPISDTTIMASAGAQCNHVNHVSTQLPYALVVAVVSFVTYIVAGLLLMAGLGGLTWIALPIGICLMIATLVCIKKTVAKK